MRWFSINNLLIVLLLLTFIVDWYVKHSLLKVLKVWCQCHSEAGLPSMTMPVCTQQQQRSTFSLTVVSFCWTNICWSDMVMQQFQRCGMCWSDIHWNDLSTVSLLRALNWVLWMELAGMCGASAGGDKATGVDIKIMLVVQTCFV